ncbi:MAG: hypothetical protein V3V55_00865, partial [Rhodospirillales bacterium]
MKLHFLTVISAVLVLLGGVFLPSTGDTAEAYLSRYPKGTFAAPAPVRINKLKQQKQLAAADPPKPKAPSPVKPAAKKVGQVFRDCADCPEMVVIPKGSFRMGDLNGGGYSNE